MYGRWLKKTSLGKKEKPASVINEKSPNPAGNSEEKPIYWSMKKLLKQMINKRKNQQIQIDEKPPNPGRTKEENR